LIYFAPVLINRHAFRKVCRYRTLRARFAYPTLRKERRMGPPSLGDRGMKDVPQGLKPDVFLIIYGTTKVVP
jgi:hypothetical protein